MITLKEITDYLKSIIQCDTWTRGWIDETKENAIALYDRQGNPYRHGIGQALSFSSGRYSLLIHWNKNKDETEAKAQEIFKILESARPRIIGNYQVIALELEFETPMSLGKDSNKIYEYIIDFTIKYQKGDK